MTKVKLGDVAIERKQTYKGNKDNILSVGLEHLTPSEVRLSRWDINIDNTFTKGFTKGQILLGRRRAYLKKAVIAPFDGICSGDITVIEAIPNKIREDLLPFVIQNDRFFDYATKGSAGSLSPRVKWEYLKEYEFDLPPIEEQERLAKLLWAAYELKESYKKLIVATDEMVKAQFIEMFGNPNINKNSTEIRRLGDIASYINGFAFKPKDWEKAGLPIIRIQNLTGSNEDYNYYNGIYPPQVEVNNGDILISWSATLGIYLWNKGKALLNQHIFKVVFDKVIIDKQYFKYVVSLKLDEMFSKTHGTAMKHIVKSEFNNITIFYPPEKEQQKFSRILLSSDQSKAELQQSIEKIDDVMKSLLP